MVMQQEIKERIRRLQDRLAGKELAGALLSHPIDIYYFSGTRQNALLWIPASGEAVLLVRKSYSRAQQESPLAEVHPFPSSKAFAATLPGGAGKIGLTFDVLPVAQYNYFGKILPGREFVDISMVVRELRSVKSATELELMRRGGARLSAVFDQIPEFLRRGMREVDLSAAFEARLRTAGGEGYVRMRAANQELFMGLAVAGDNACEPGFFDGAVTGRGLSGAAAHGASEGAIAENSPILVDYTGVFDGYILDMTRMFVFGGLDIERQRAFDLSLAIQEEIRNRLRPGMICTELYARALAMAEEAGLAEYFMGVPGENARFVGHGVGLELDELPILAAGFEVPLQAGQTVAVEPKFVFPGYGAVGIENTFVVTAEGGSPLTITPDAVISL